MVEFTFLELHFEDSDLTANAPYSRGETDAVSDDGPAVDSAGSRKGTVFALLVGLGFSIAVAYLVRKKLSGDGDEDGADDGSTSAPDV
jgi:hypothetical protein